MSHETARHNYDRMSRVYDLFAGSEKRFTEAGLRLLAPAPGTNVLEIGCGTGHALAKLSSLGVHVTGLDLSAGMLARAQRTVTRRRREPVERSGANVALCQADAIHLPFKANSFNAVFLSFTLELFPEEEIPLLLKECRRVLRWDGHLGVVSLAKENTRMVRVYEWFHARWPQVIDCRPIYVHKDLIRAGYEIREAQRMVMWGLPVEIIVANKDMQ